MICPILIGKFLHKIVMGRIKIKLYKCKIEWEMWIKISLVHQDLFKYGLNNSLEKLNLKKQNKNLNSREKCYKHSLKLEF